MIGSKFTLYRVQTVDFAVNFNQRTCYIDLCAAEWISRTQHPTMMWIFVILSVWQTSKHNIPHSIQCLKDGHLEREGIWVSWTQLPSQILPWGSEEREASLQTNTVPFSLWELLTGRIYAVDMAVDVNSWLKASISCCQCTIRGNSIWLFKVVTLHRVQSRVRVISIANLIKH